MSIKKINQKGSLVTEILITIVLILITLLSIVPMMLMGTKSTKITKNRAIEMRLAQEEIENFNNEKFSILLDVLTNKIKLANISGFTPEKFISGEKNYSETKILYINPNTGEIKKELTPGDYNKANIKLTYSYFVGNPSLLDDSIQLLVEVQIEGKSTKPVSLRSVLNRDKL